MSQALFLDPIVSVSPILTGVGNGTLTVDKLTHFTITQSYTLTCIAKSPDTIFAVVGSLDGNVGLAKAGLQFYDNDLKVFLTILQGSTAFEIGDSFTFSVQHGTDLNQDNIDDYDELPQKNFGVGVKGTNSGDHNIRFSNTTLVAYKYIQELLFTAAVAGAPGNLVSIELAAPVPPIKAAFTEQDLTFTADTGGVAGNSITVQYADFTAATHAGVTIQDIRYEADATGPAGNSITIEYVNDGTAGAETVNVTGNAVVIHMQSGVSTATQIVAAVQADPFASPLIDAAVVGLGGPNFQTGPTGPTFLTGGADAFGEAGDEEVSVVGSAITVTLQSGVSTATQVKAAIDGFPAAAALIDTSISGVGSNPQTTPFGPTNLAGGVDGYGYEGTEVCQVTGNAVKIYMEAGRSSASQVKAAFDLVGAATALASCTIIGLSLNKMYGPYAARLLSGGLDKNYALNHDELTDPSDFVEGNANLRARDLQLRSQLKVAGHSRFSESVTLDDQNSDNLSGLAVANTQQTINNLMQNDKLTLRTDTDSAVVWAAPNFSFTNDVIIDFPDSDVYNSILAAESPISLADGESLYVMLNRTTSGSVNPIVSTTVPKSVDAYRVASRFGSSLILADNTLLKDGSSASIGEGSAGGSGSGVVSVDFHDPISSTLPTGATVTIDGVAGSNGDLVLFTALTVNNNRVYQLGGVGTSITWTPASVFSTGLLPLDGELIVITQGNGFGNQLGQYVNTTFEFNKNVRYFSGADYWEVSSIKTSTLADNTTGNVFTVNYAGSENIIVDFSIVRSTTHEIGTLFLKTDGSTVAISASGASIGAAGVSFDADISGSTVRLRYTSTSTGSAATMKYYIRRWSNTSGGPGGPPSYTGASTSLIAAGSDTEVQYNSSGNLAGDPSFTWDAATGSIDLNGLKISGLSAPFTILNNQAVLATIVTLVAADYESFIVEYKLVRDGVRQTGRLLVASDATSNSAISDDFVATNGIGCGVAFDAVLSAGNLLLQYTSDNSGFNGTLTYSIRKLG